LTSLDNCTLDRFKLEYSPGSNIALRGLDKLTLDQFTLDARRQLTTEQDISVKWNQNSYIFEDCKIKYQQAGQVWSQNKIKWNQAAYILDTCKIKYNQLHYVNELTKIKYNQNSFVYPNSKLKWNQSSVVYPESIIKWDQTAYILDTCKIKYNQLHYVNELTKIKYNQASMVYPESIIKWNQSSMVYPESIIKWDQAAYILDTCKIKYSQLHYVNELTKIKYNQASMVYPESIIKWNQNSMVYPESIIKWDQNSYINNILKMKWYQGPSLKTTLVNYLEVITLQGSKLYPIIEDASIEKGVEIDTAKISIYENIPPYSLCRLFVNYNIILFEGISLSCPKKGNLYELEIVDYLEHLQPSSPKPGLYLRRYEWQNVQIQNFVSSNKPTDNSNILGLLYMANSVIHHVLFEPYDVPNHIYVWTITGSPYVITEVFENVTLMTQKTSIVQLQSATGWYYDTMANKLYIRHTGDVSPYDVVTTIPNIWDGPMPIRMGTLATSKSTSVILFAETADFDIPLETLNTYLYSFGLEYESSVRNEVTYIDIVETRGAGSSSCPANTYVSSINILKINEIDSNNAKYSTNGVVLQAYGQGAGSVTAGAYRNMNIGGRFVYLEDASIHGEAQATDYVNNYLEEMYLPSQSITFEVPLDISGVYDNRRIGDSIKVIIPLEDFIKDLRIQKLQIYLKDSTIKITAGDRLFSLEQKLKAIKSANEKYRKHLEDTTEEFSYNEELNIDSGITRDFDFEIKDNALSIQKLELSYDVAKMVVDSASSAPTSSPGGAEAGEEEGTGHTHKIKAGEKADKSTMTIEVAAKTHSHPLSLANMGAPTSLVYFPSVNHKHPAGTLVNGNPSATTTVINSISYTTYSAATTTHTHNQGTLVNGNPNATVAVINSIGYSTIPIVNYGHTHPSGTLINGTADNPATILQTFTLLYGNCTAPNCVRTFACGSQNTTKSVSAYNHLHGISGNTGAPSGTPTTITYAYTHGTVAVSSSTHIHTITGNTGAPSGTPTTITYAYTHGTVAVSSSTHIHTITGNTGTPDLTDGEAAGPGHRHTGRTDDNTTGEFVSHKDHDHNIGGKEVAEQETEQIITMPESESWTVPTYQNENGDWLDCESMAEIPSGNSEMSELNPDMYLSLSIVSGSTVTPISGSPFVVNTEDDSKNSGGPILIDTLVTKDGKYKVRATVANKTEPGSACRCKLAIRINGKIFVDTILKG
jgi:hypothetical protein